MKNFIENPHFFKNILPPLLPDSVVTDLSFLLQLYKYTKLIIDKRELQLKRLIYLIDNYNLLTKDEFKLMKQIKDKRIKEWIKKYSLKNK